MKMAIFLKKSLGIHNSVKPANGPISHRVRELVFVRDGGKCRICGDNELESMTIDHIIPQCKGGGHHPRNLQILCRSCNISKGGRI